MRWHDVPVDRQHAGLKFALGLQPRPDQRIALGKRHKPELVARWQARDKRHQLIVLVIQGHIAVERELDPLQQLLRQGFFLFIQQHGVVVRLVLVVVDQFQ